MDAEKIARAAAVLPICASHVRLQKSIIWPDDKVICPTWEAKP